MVAKAEYMDDNRFYLVGDELVYCAYISDVGGAMEDNTNINFCPMCGRDLRKEVIANVLCTVGK